jgi:hypothetical protein
VNRAEPLLAPDEWKHTRDIDKLMLGDMGCLYIFIDHKENLHAVLDCY